jgi:pyruvate dehydrogenase E2 component (dihydrolipoyllysine-residue acetyltransferase)
VAARLGLQLHGLAGSGPFGRVQLADVQASKVRAPIDSPEPAEPEGRPAVVAAEAPDVLASQLTPEGEAQRVVGERRSTPIPAQAVLTCEVDLTEAEMLCGQLREEWSRDGIEPAATHLVIRAAALALVEYPRLNSLRHRNGVATRSVVNIGLAVAVKGESVSPVVHDAASKSLRMISATCVELDARSRAAALSPADLSEATFTMVRIDEAGVDTLIPSINPGQVATLGIGSKRDAPRYVEGDLLRRSLLPLSLAFDEHLIDAAYAAGFLARLRRLVERPYLLLIDA